MVENIELRSYRTRYESEDEIEEYHTIEPVTEIGDPVKYFPSENNINEYEFFTETFKSSKKGTRKKKSKKKEKKVNNIVDLMNTEMASIIVPVTANIITFVDYDDMQLHRLTKSNPSIFNRFIRRFTVDAENGNAQKPEVLKLTPKFPKITENVSEESDTVAHHIDPVMFDDLLSNHSREENIVTEKFLDITLENLQFECHYHFSLEELLSVKLVEIFEKYKNLKETLFRLQTQIKISRDTKDNLKNDLIAANPDSKNNIRFEPTLRKYTAKLFQFKKQYKETLLTETEITHKMDSLWSDIEIVRSKSKCVKTPIILKFHEMNEKEVQEKWIEVFNQEYSDYLDEIEFDYVSKFLDYKAWKSTKDGPEVPKPKLEINEKMIKEEVEKFVNIVTGKEKKKYTLVQNDNFIVNKSINKKLLTSTDFLYNFEVYIDDIFVCESEQYYTKTFIVEFTENFSIQILPHNQTLKVILLENDERFSVMSINLDDIKSFEDNTEPTKVEFKCDYYIKPTNKHIGSGNTLKEIAKINNVRLKSSNLFEKELFSTCTVGIGLRSKDTSTNSQTNAIKSSMDTGRQIQRLLHGIDKPNVNLLLDLINKVYGQDVSNDESMVLTLKELCKETMPVNNNFAVDLDAPEYTRLKLLRLRNQGGFSYISNKIIPLLASQISTEQLECLTKANSDDIDVEYFTSKQVDMDPIEVKIYVGVKYMEKMNKNMLEILNEQLLKKTYKDVVRDYSYGGWRNFFSRTSPWASLAPSNITKQQLLNESLNQEHEIIITVVKAYNLLDRSPPVLEETENEDKIAGFKVRPLRPFVRISYRGSSVQTPTSIGCHPTWNHTVKMKTILSPLSCLQIDIYDQYKTYIPENISDEDSGKTVRYRVCNKWLGTIEVPVNTVLYLGSLRGTFKITTPPVLFGYETVQAKESSLLSEINHLIKKDVSFISLNITTSLFRFSGLQVYYQPMPNKDEDYLIKHLNQFVTDYTNEFPSRCLSLTFIDSNGLNKCVTQFLNRISLPDADYFPKNPKTCESAVSKSSGLSQSSSRSSGRKKDLEIERIAHVEEDSVYSGGTSWKSMNDVTRLIGICLRYVSLIPNYEVTESHAITLTGLELLRMLYGNHLDHTLLLASYFLHLNIKCWVAIGFGLPRGSSSYVIIQYDVSTSKFVEIHDVSKRGLFTRNEYVFYVCDAVCGERYDIRDVGCPMKSVDYVFDDEEIWVNVQSSQDCENMSFDFSKSSDWRPVFDKKIFPVSSSVLNNSSLYTAPSNVDNLRQILETKIKGKIQKWRPHTKTVWNRYCSSLLRDMLPYLEYWSLNPTDNKPGPSNKLKQFMLTYKVFGFPLNMPFLTVKSVTSRIKATSLHASDDPDIEFALAVEVYAYPNNVLSVWVFLASITRI